jgi:hypothetical protein
MDFIAEMASRPQSTMTSASSSKPPLRLEMDKYLSMNVPTDMNIDNMEGEILKWWNKNRDELPLLAELAREYLCIPASSAPSERLFSHAGNIVTDTRHSLDSENVSKLLFVKENMHRCLSSWKRWKTKIPEENQHYEQWEPSEALPPSQPTQSQPDQSDDDDASASLLNAPRKKKYDAAARRRYHQEHPNSTSPSLAGSPENTQNKRKAKVPKNQPKMSDMLKRKKQPTFTDDSDSEGTSQPAVQKSPKKRKHSAVDASTTSQVSIQPPEKKKKQSKKLSAQNVSDLLTEPDMFADDDEDN